MTRSRGYQGYQTHAVSRPMLLASICVEPSAGLTHDEALALLKKTHPTADMWLWEDL